MLILSYINLKGEPLTGGFHIPCHSYSSCNTFIKEAEQYFSEGKDYILRDEMSNVTLITHKWYSSDDVYYAKLEVLNGD